MNRQETETGVRNEVETVPRAAAVRAPAPLAVDRTRWGPIWAGLVMTFSLFLVLEALLFSIGTLSLKTAGADIVVDHPWITWILAMIAFFIGGIVASATSAVRGPGVGVFAGLLLWALTTTLFAVVSFFGAGVAAGTVGGLVSRFMSLHALQHAASVSPAALRELRTASGWALLTLVTTALAAALGGILGSIGGRPLGYAAREKPRQ